MKLLIATLLLSFAAFSQIKTSDYGSTEAVSFTADASHIVAATTTPSELVISDRRGRMTVKISMDGKVTLGEGVKPDEAAKEFFAALERAGLRRAAECKSISEEKSR